MKRSRRRLWLAFASASVSFGSALAVPVLGQSNVDPAHKVTWGENMGWVDVGAGALRGSSNIPSRSNRPSSVDAYQVHAASVMPQIEKGGNQDEADQTVRA